MTNVILCTCPDEITAKQLALQLVKKKLAACVNIVSQVQSVFSWNNQIEETHEVLLIIKSAEKNYDEIEAFIQSQHPYEVPEIIALTVSKGSRQYLEWINQ
jgi:periplasmic divalent cation tolerance protein